MDEDWVMHLERLLGPDFRCFSPSPILPDL